MTIKYLKLVVFEDRTQYSAFAVDGKYTNIREAKLRKYLEGMGLTNNVDFWIGVPDQRCFKSLYHVYPLNDEAILAMKLRFQ